MDKHAADIPLLVNRDHPLPDGYAPDLETIEDSPALRCDRRCLSALADFVAASRDAGFHPAIVSAYRDQKEQRGCFARAVDRFWVHGTTLEEALTEAQRYVAAPGASEHETGLAFDIKDTDYKGRDAGLENSPGQRWLIAHCHEFGFISRYPRDKEQITHVAFEPCHFRYVGESHATAIVERGLTLEEYVNTLE